MPDNQLWKIMPARFKSAICPMLARHIALLALAAIASAGVPVFVMMPLNASLFIPTDWGHAHLVSSELGRLTLSALTNVPAASGPSRKTSKATCSCM